MKQRIAKAIEKINEMKFFEKSNKTDKPLAKLNSAPKKRLKSLEAEVKEGTLLLTLWGKKDIKEYHKQLYANK